MQMAGNIYNTTLDILNKSKNENISTSLAANKIAEKRIEWVSFSGMDKRILLEARSKILRRKENDHPKILHLRGELVHI